MDLGHMRIRGTRAFHLVKEMVGGYSNIGATLTDFKIFKRDMKAFIGGRDVEMVINHLKNKRDCCKGYVFEYVADEEDTLTRLFGADSKSANDREMFVDVVSFDATYGTNKALDTQRNNRWTLDNESTKYSPILKTELYIERYAANIFTHNILKEFQNEIFAGSESDLTNLRSILENVKQLRNIVQVPEGTTNVLFKADYFKTVIGMENPSQVNIKPPKVAQNKGCGKRHRATRELMIEKANRPKKMCGNCQELGHHNKRSYPKKTCVENLDVNVQEHVGNEDDPHIAA
ncbi:hypothetical protein QQ045_003885 [Rhodiola kirilowii]